MGFRKYEDEIDGLPHIVWLDDEEKAEKKKTKEKNRSSDEDTKGRRLFKPFR